MLPLSSSLLLLYLFVCPLGSSLRLVWFGTGTHIMHQILTFWPSHIFPFHSALDAAAVLLFS